MAKVSKHNEGSDITSENRDAAYNEHPQHQEVTETTNLKTGGEAQGP